MTSVNRSGFADLNRLGTIDTQRAGDPVARLVQELGITEADLQKIGDGDSVIRGAAEFGALYDRLGQLDRQSPPPSAGISRAERLYRAYVGDRERPQAKKFDQLKTHADFDAASSEVQTRGAARILDRIGLASPRAPKTDDAAAFSTWATREANRLDGVRSEVGARQHELELLIGHRNGKGADKSGYYDRLIDDAKQYVGEQRALAAKGDAGAKARAERGEKVISWAEREQVEARAVFRSFTARSIDAAGWIDDASHALRTGAAVVGENGAVFADHAAAVAAYRSGIEKAQQDGVIAPELLDSSPWIARYGQAQHQLEATALLHQQLTQRAASDPMFAEWLASSHLLDALEGEEQHLLTAMSEISDVVRAQKTQEVAGQTGAVLDTRDRALALAETATGALLKEDNGRLEKYERELGGELAEVKKEIRRLEAEKKRLEDIAKQPPNRITSAEALFEQRAARLALSGVVPDQKERPISLEKQIRLLRQSAEVLSLARTEIDTRQQYLSDVVGQLANRYSLRIMNPNAKPDQVIGELQSFAPVPGFSKEGDVLSLKVGKHTYRMGPDSAYGTQRRFVIEYAKLQHEQQAKAYVVMRQSLLEIGIWYSDLDALGFKKDSVAELPGMIDFFNHLTGRVNGEDKALIAWTQKPAGAPPGMTDPSLANRGGVALAAAAKEKGFGAVLERKELLALVKEGALEPEALAFARVLLLSKDLKDQLGANDLGDIKVADLENFGSQAELIQTYFSNKKNDKKADANAPAAESISPTYFPGAKELVADLDPKLHPWNGADNPLFEKLRPLDKGQRAYVLALFDATYSKKYGDDYLAAALKTMNVGNGFAFMSLLQGKTAKEAGAEFASDYLATHQSADAFVRHHNAAPYYLQKANQREGFDLPQNLIDAHDVRLRRMVDLNDKRNTLLAERASMESVHNLGVANKTKTPAADDQLNRIFKELGPVEAEMKVLAGEMTILADSLLDAYSAEVTEHNAEAERTRSMFKKLGIAAAATLGAYLTAGALAPEAGVLWAGVAATVVGTSAGMTTAFVFDVAEQAMDHGWKDVSLKKAGWAALDAAPESFAAALPTGFLTAAVAARAGLLYKTLEGARAVRVLGMTVKPAEMMLKAGTVASYVGVSSYVGNVASAAYYHYVKDRPDIAAQIMKDAPRDALFAGVSAALLMPLSRFSGMTGMVADAGGNAAQQIIFNKISGKAWDDELVSSLVMGAALGKIFETHRNLTAAKQLNTAGVVGAEVRLPSDKTNSTWQIESVNADRGFVMVKSGEVRQKVIASVLSDANPHLTAKKVAPAAAEVDPKPVDVGGTELRALRTDLEQRVQKQIGAGVDVTTRTSAGPNGTASMQVTLHAKGSDVPLAEMSLAIDPAKKRIKVEGTGNQPMLAAQADFLSTHFPGWELNGKSRIPALEARLDRVAPKGSWDRAAVVGVDVATGKVTIEANGKQQQLGLADAVRQHPELAIGLEINHGGKRFRVGDADAKGRFGLIPMDENAKVGDRWPRVTAEEIVAAAPQAIERMMTPPAVRVREPAMIDGELRMTDAHGYSLLATDPKSGLAYVRNPAGAIETRPLDQVVYEHSGVAAGSLNPAQHARYQEQLESLSDSDLTDWAHLRSAAADISHEHAALADRMLGLGYSVPEIDSLLGSVRDVPQSELGKLFSAKGITQDFVTSCSPAACLYGIAAADPKLAKLFKEHPDLAAWWQKNMLERNGGSAQVRADADYAGRGDATGAGTTVEPLRTTGDGRSFYRASDLHPSLTARVLRDPGFFKNREVTVVLHGAPQEILRVKGDANGNLSIDGKKVKGALFEPMVVNGELVVGFKKGKSVVSIDELGLPKDVPPPRRDAGMTHANDAELLGLLEMKLGERYLMRNPTALTETQYFGAIDWSLDNHHPVALGVEWTNPKDGKSLNAAHQLWIQDKRTVRGKTEYLVYDPHFNEPRWMGKSQLQSYTPFPGMVGKPMHLLLPDYVQLPGASAVRTRTIPTTTGTPDVPLGSLLRDRTAQIVSEAKQRIGIEVENRKAGRPVDEDRLREATLAMAIWDDGRKNGVTPRLTEYRREFKEGKIVKAEIDLRTDSALFEVTNGRGDDKLVQYEDRLRAGQVGNQGHLPVVLLGSDRLLPDVRRALDAQGVMVVDTVEHAVAINRLYKTDPDVMGRLWSLDAFDRKAALSELLDARTPAARTEIAQRYGVATGEMVVVNQRAEAVLGDASKAWAKGMSAPQAEAVQRFLESRPADRSSRVAIILNADGSVGVTLRTRLPQSKTWREASVQIQ